MIADFKFEDAFGSNVIGIDEVGRGPLAGPVVAAAIIINKAALKLGLNDSKKLTPSKREDIFLQLTNDYSYSLGVIEVEVIDKIGILQATFQAMKKAFEGLNVKEECVVLVDGNQKPFYTPNLHTIVKGDAKCATIAAASIIAKVTRDKIMADLSHVYPQFGWNKNFGYGTKAHIQALQQYGATVHHRKSFIKSLIQPQNPMSF